MLNIELPYDLAIPLLGIYPRDLKADVHMKTGTRTFIAALFIIARKEKQLEYPWTYGRKNKAMEYYSVIEELGTAKYCKVEEAWKRYAQWKKPVTKGHMSYDSIYVKHPEQTSP